MTKSSVNKKLSRYGERFTLRFHIKEEIYQLSDSKKTPHLVAVFYKTDGDLAERTWERLEELHKEHQQLKQENNNLRAALRYELEKDLPSAPVGQCRCAPEPHRSDNK